MGSLRFKIIFYIGVFVLTFLMASRGYSTLHIAATVVVAGSLAFLPYVYALLIEKRIDRLETFLRKQKGNPAIYINYVLANKLEDEASSIMAQLIRKYKEPNKQALFKAAYGLYRKDMNAVREAVPYIRLSNYRAYYEVILLVEDGRSDQALGALDAIKRPWMRSALMAEIELRAGRHDAASQHAREALRAVRGVHRYVMYKEYERLLPQSIAGLSY
ncbi:hypothetical protein [Paenibacillus xanthanilyticus]|uniref:hypothetical protein n=1 Tax=Paenibacillus xanthanilyticus TaxID=1783531 RepID=UPI00366AABF7